MAWGASWLVEKAPGVGVEVWGHRDKTEHRGVDCQAAFNSATA